VRLRCRRAPPLSRRIVVVVVVVVVAITQSVSVIQRLVTAKVAVFIDRQRTGARALLERVGELGVLAEAALVAEERVELLVVDVATLSALIAVLSVRLVVVGWRLSEIETK
jgi:hypothetical protein